MPDQTFMPAIAAALDGLSFSEAFRQCVLDDPEVVAAGKLAVSSKDYDQGDVFKTGEVPNLVGYRWPLNLTATTLVNAFGYTPMLILGTGYEPPKPLPHASLSAAAAVLADRWGVLIGFLRRGEVVAVDMGDRKLGKGAWHRTGAVVDVQNGDLFDADNDQPLHRGLMLCRADKLPAVEAPPIRSIVPKRGDQATVNVISMALGHRSAGRPVIARSRGPKPKQGPRVQAEMLAALREGQLTADQLDEMAEEALAATYNASRDTCRKARGRALSEFKSRQIATIDK